MHRNFYIAFSLPWLCLELSMTTAEENREQPIIAEHIDYGELGWVNTTKEWYNKRWRETNLTPQSRMEVGTVVELYTRNNQREPERLVPMEKIWSKFMDCRIPTRVIIHGWLSGNSVQWVKDLTNEILRREKVNVLAVGYNSKVMYRQCVQNLRVVALEVIFLLRHMKNTCGLDFSSLHIIGHSLGAHVAGYIGQELRGIGRITGLDPAEPMFLFMPEFVRLDPSDAAFVDVIHTNMGNKSVIQGFGFSEPLGHVDFYPNDGKLQPGCSLLEMPQNFFRKGIRAAGDFASCSHSRAIELFTESVNSECPFTAIACNSQAEFSQGKCVSCGDHFERCASMGYNAAATFTENRGQHAKMFLITAPSPPFCLHVYFVTLDVAVGPENARQGKLQISFQGDSGIAKNVPLTRTKSSLGSTPMFGFRIPNIFGAPDKLPLLVPGRNVTLLGVHETFAGESIDVAEIYWENYAHSTETWVLPCFFNCGSKPIRLSRLIIVSPGKYKKPTKVNTLCPVGGGSFVLIQSSSNAVFSKAACERKPARDSNTQVNRVMKDRAL